MSLALLGDGFDLHGGGQDLIFPHHDNERAQAVANGQHFARHWMHNGLVTVAGEKMSKSLSNFTTLDELLEHCDPRSYRLLVARAHYRSPLEVNATTIESAASSLARIDALVRRLGEVVPLAPSEDANGLRQRFVIAMENDLDSPSAVAEIFEAVRRANSLSDRGDLAAARALTDMVQELLGALGIEVHGSEVVDSDVADLVARRDLARLDRDFATSDLLRVELEALGWVVEDTPAGTRVHR
jgi:cysteinyl-tRNA synthetase